MAQFFKQSWIDKVVESCDIVDVISKYIELKQKGRTFWGNCPFHHENEPSFAVSPEGQFFNCFGCHVGGNVITFVSKYETLSFTEAVKLLAKQNNIELPSDIDDEQIRQNAVLKRKILDINLVCARYYRDNLFSENGEKAMEYLKKRELPVDVIKRFGLGYSSSWEGLVEHLKSQKISLEDGYKAGVLGKKNGRYYDFFAERIIFPIINPMGEILGFSARVIKKEYTGGKYKNSPDSLCFNKSTILYGINFLKKACQKRAVEYGIICEGQMDVIAMNKTGYDNTVASLGTALTIQHAKELKKYVNKVIVCFDGDSAGVKATIRSLDILEEAGLTVYVLTLPEGLDPDEYIKKYGKDNFEELLATKRESRNDYKYNTIRKKYNLTNNKEKSDFIKEILTFVDKLETNSDREIYLKQIQKETKVPVEVLRHDLKNGIVEVKVEELKVEQNQWYIDSLEFIFSSYLHQKEYATKFNISIINHSFYAMLNNLLKDYQVNDTIFEVLKNKFGDQKEVDRLKNYNFNNVVNCEYYYKDCIKRIKIYEKERELQVLNDNISTITDVKELRENVIKIDKISGEIQKLKSEE